MFRPPACCKLPAHASLYWFSAHGLRPWFCQTIYMVSAHGSHSNSRRYFVPSFSSSPTISGGYGFCPAATSSLQDSISQIFEYLDSKFQALESRSKENLEFLNNGENSMPEREFATAARIKEQKEVSLADLRNALPPSTLEIPELVDCPPCS